MVRFIVIIQEQVEILHPLVQLLFPARTEYTHSYERHGMRMVSQ